MTWIMESSTSGCGSPYSETVAGIVVFWQASYAKDVVNVGEPL